jgi:D-alanine-D-alanine ligase
MTRRLVTRDRQRIATPWLYLLLGIGLVPFLLMALRMLALASVEAGGLALAGEWLNRHLALQWIDHEDRDVVLYILMLPLSALLIAVTRLTLGIRVLGFRSILIAIGMQEIGILPCLLLIALIAGTVIIVRPSMRRSGMPLFARVAVVLCIVAFTMLAGLLTGAWLDSVTLWSMAFFPVVILAMLAESVAETVARDGLAMAVWRTSTTIVLACVLAGINQLTPLRELALSCPELLLTSLVLIVLVSEFLDLRLFENFRPGVTRGKAHSDKPVIVLVRNRFPEPPPRRAAAQIPKRYRRASLQALIDQLRHRDYEVEVLECDFTLPAKLASLAQSAFGPRGSGLCVLNAAGGVQGAGRLAQVSTVCEMLGVPYAGPPVESAALWDDRKRQLERLDAMGLQIPAELSVAEARRDLEAGRADLWVRPRRFPDQGATRIRSERHLKATCRKIERQYGEVLIERVPAGRPVTAVVLHPQSPEEPRVLPLLKRGAGRNLFHHEAGLNRSSQDAAVQVAVRAARALDCRDLVRVDLYCTDTGEITVSRVIAIDPLSFRSATATAARLSGYSLADIAEECVRAALVRVPMSIPDPGRGARISSINSQSSPNRRTSPCPTSASSATV